MYQKSPAPLESGFFNILKQAKLIVRAFNPQRITRNSQPGTYDMPRIDDYINARKIAIEKLSQEPFDVILKRSGYESPDASTFLIPFLDRIYKVRYPQFEFEDQIDSGREIPLQEQVLILHYLMAPKMPLPTGQWISYREIPGASFYFSAFVKRAVEPLKKVFGQNPSGFTSSAEKLHGIKIDSGDAGFEFKILPNVILQLIIWSGDEEFPAEANILFDKTIGEALSPEDVAWLAGMIVYRLIALAH